MKFKTIKKLAAIKIVQICSDFGFSGNSGSTSVLGLGDDGHMYHYAPAGGGMWGENYSNEWVAQEKIN